MDSAEFEELARESTGKITTGAYHHKIEYPQHLDFVQEPTLVGPYRALINFKLRQVAYFKKRGISTQEFAIAQLYKTRRKKLFRAWKERGNIGANELGIKLPEHIPTGGYGEMFGEELYSIEGFTPDESSKVADVGAQYGDYAVLCAKVYGSKEIHAFEPVKENFNFMEELITLNNLDNVKTYCVGLSDTKYDQVLSYTDQMLSASRVGTKTQLFSFDKLDNFHLKCDILKIDVEGYELKVLKGGMGTVVENMPRIIMEVHSKRLYKASLELLTGLGYKLVRKNWLSYLNGFNQNIFLEPVK